MNCVNVVVRGNVGHDLNLSEIHSSYPSSKLYTSLPEMLVMKKDKITLILFKKGAFRFMGKVDANQVDFYILEFMDETPDLMFAMLGAHKELQTQKFVYKLPGPVPIEKLNEGVCELELFPTRHLT